MVAAWLGVMCLAATMASCSDDTTAEAVVVSAAEARPGEDLPDAERPILTVAGAVAAELHLDLGAIESLAVVEAVIYEPFLERDVTFRGVWLEDLLAVAGVEVGATTLDLHALDDYQVELGLSDIDAGDALLATRADGAEIPVAEGGPTRLVFLDDRGPGRNDDLWIWNLDVLTVG